MAATILGATALSTTWSGAAFAQFRHHHHHNGGGGGTGAGGGSGSGGGGTTTGGGGSTTGGGGTTTGGGGGTTTGGGGTTTGVTDPGPRTGGPDAGASLDGLTQAELAFFTAARDIFQEVDEVPTGLGPRFNSNSCSSCHAQPDVGGSSPPVNPQIAAAAAGGATNTIPSFITANGPTREVRFVNNADGTPDGGVHDLFTITGRTDAPGCVLQQPDFAGALAANNAIFRIPTPTFGLGLVENTPDSTLQAGFDSSATLRASLGISGHFNRSGNDGTITRFGWKAQNKSLVIFAGEAYNVEQGVTNEAFPNERETDPHCQFNGTPESIFPLVSANLGSDAANFQSDIELFAGFMRLLGPPTPSALPTQVASSILGGTTASPGSTVFTNIGCQACHALSLTTGKSPYAALTNVTYNSFSDYAVHNMGTGLGDRVSQGNANGQEFRSAPLWGVGQRLFFLHDGRTADIVQAILQHASQGSEANTVINNFNLLSAADKQSLVDFLRSL
jgi:CxxC motif-containing protein (DUF1111 family)